LTVEDNNSSILVSHPKCFIFHVLYLLPTGALPLTYHTAIAYMDLCAILAISLFVSGIGVRQRS
jgi:hypothetical protein